MYKKCVCVVSRLVIILYNTRIIQYKGWSVDRAVVSHGILVASIP